MIFRPDIKPPMWGPPAAIQYAARANAERLGIDYSRILLLIPSWENGGLPFDVISARPPLSGSMGWKDGNALFTPSQSFATYTNPMSGVPTALSGFCRFMHTNPIFVNIERLISSRHETNNTGWSFSAGRASGISPNRKQGLLFTIFGVADYVFPLDTLNAPSETVFTDNGFSWAGNQLKFYFGGDLKRTTTTGNMAAGSPFIHQNKVRNSDATPGPTTGQQAICIAARELWPQSVFAQLATTPYALLVPVARPVYFDLGAGGGTFSASCGSTLFSSDIQASIARSLTASAAASLTSSDIAVTTAANYLLSAACHASVSSSEILASILRQVQAQCDSSLTSQDVILAILRQLVASCAGSLTASDITVSTVAEKLFQAACAASLTSSDSALNIARTLSCNCNGVVSSSDAMLTIAGLITFLAECTASLSGSDVTASIARVLSAESLASVSSTDIAVTNLVALAATCDSTVSAADVALNLQMYLQAVCDGTLSADDASVHVAAMLSAACDATISSSDIRVIMGDEVIARIVTILAESRQFQIDAERRDFVLMAERKY